MSLTHFRCFFYIRRSSTDIHLDFKKDAVCSSS